VWPLYEVLRQQFKAYVVLGQDVSFDEMMVPYTGRSSHILKMKNKPIAEGFKIWALCDHGYTWDFLWYSRIKSKLDTYNYTLISIKTNVYIFRNCRGNKTP
jgi:hypothetical protein